MAGTDWKSALAALGATSDNVEASEKKEVDKKKRVGVVYSTDTDFGYSENSDDEMMTVPKKQQKLRLYMERAGRGGKTVTIVKFFVGSEDDMMDLCKSLKQRCGVGGSVKDGEIISQGDPRERLLDILKKDGYTQTK